MKIKRNTSVSLEFRSNIGIHWAVFPNHFSKWFTSNDVSFYKCCHLFWSCWTYGGMLHCTALSWKNATLCWKATLLWRNLARSTGLHSLYFRFIFTHRQVEASLRWPIFDENPSRLQRKMIMMWGTNRNNKDSDEFRVQQLWLPNLGKSPQDVPLFVIWQL